MSTYWSIVVESEGLEPDEYKEMLKRFWNWKPIKMRLEKSWGIDMRQEYRRNPVGNMHHLGPSILGDGKGQVSFGGRASYTVGSKKWYAGFYDSWRESQGLPPLFNIPEAFYESLTDVVLVWTVYGEGYKKHRTKKRKHT
jgi:hypothetical protein